MEDVDSGKPPPGQRKKSQLGKKNENDRICRYVAKTKTRKKSSLMA